MDDTILVFPEQTTPEDPPPAFLPIAKAIGLLMRHFDLRFTARKTIGGYIFDIEEMEVRHG